MPAIATLGIMQITQISNTLSVSEMCINLGRTYCFVNSEQADFHWLIFLATVLTSVVLSSGHRCIKRPETHIVLSNHFLTSIQLLLHISFLTLVEQTKLTHSRFCRHITSSSGWSNGGLKGSWRPLTNSQYSI